MRSDEQTWSKNTFLDVKTGGGGHGNKNWPTADGQASSKRCFKSGQRTVDALTLGTTHSTTKHHRPSVDKSASTQQTLGKGDKQNNATTVEATPLNLWKPLKKKEMMGGTKTMA